MSKEIKEVSIKKSINQRRKESKEYKEILKNRVVLKCSCKRTKSARRERGKYGTCRCDSYSLDYNLGVIMSNALFQYIADSKMAIMRDDWALLEKHAKAIRDYSTVDSWDNLCEDKERDKRFEFYKKEREWREAMYWLMENWQGLWW